MIGLKKNLGKNLGGIFSPDDTATPQEATTWKYAIKVLEWVMSDSKDAVIVTRCDGKN